MGYHEFSKWSFNGGTLPNNAYVRKRKILKIKNAQLYNTGKYVCHGTIKINSSNDKIHTISPFEATGILVVKSKLLINLLSLNLGL